ncbi:MAG: EF-P lysine aminoacylase GenX [Gammaproteobacteria bacterium]|nr:EF-P lysine aminoacylase GenX [Gammaproteobacteria bacterium]
MLGGQKINACWAPGASLDNIKIRAHVLQTMRAFFAQRDVLEVDTPILGRATTTDPNINSLYSAVQLSGAERQKMYLHTSPEFAMKRLLAAGAGAIYQICKVFRDEEMGRYHNPEFTMLEWYRPAYNYEQLMDEVADLLACFMPDRQVITLSYGEAFIQYAQINPFEADLMALKNCLYQHNIQMNTDAVLDARDDVLDLLMGEVVASRLGTNNTIVFLYDFPASQAALAQLKVGQPALAERFEVFVEGVELANGYQELCDSIELRKRMNKDNSKRTEKGLTEVNVDEQLLSAMQHGLPACAGVALGIERLLMRVCNARHIDEVMTFTAARA